MMNQNEILDIIQNIISEYRTSKYKAGDISLITGLQKQSDGTWKHPSGKEVDSKTTKQKPRASVKRNPKSRVDNRDYKKDTYNKYVKSGKVDGDTYKKLLSLDPSTNKKYVEKLLRFFVEHDKKLDDIRDFMVNLQRLSGLGIVNPDEVLDTDNMDKTLDALKLMNSVEDTDKIRINHESQNLISTIYNENGIMITTPNIQVTACIQTMGYEWCLPLQASEKYKKYTNKFMIKPYYILDKNASDENDLKRVIALVYPDGTIELYTSTYQPVDFDSYIQDTGIEVSIFKPVAMRDINTLLTKKRN